MKPPAPWYRQFWPWVLIGLPAATVVAGFVTLAIAMHDPDGLVTDDYYKQGLAVNAQKARDREALRLGLSAAVRVSASEGMVDLSMLSGDLTSDTITLTFMHPTRAQFDRTVQLHSTGLGYEGKIEPLAPGNWHVILEPENREWRIRGRMRLPDTPVSKLEPAVL